MNDSSPSRRVLFDLPTGIRDLKKLLRVVSEYPLRKSVVWAPVDGQYRIEDLSTTIIPENFAWITVYHIHQNATYKTKV